MFVDEIKEKLKIDDVACVYSMFVYGRNALAVDGVKSVLLSTSTAMKLRVKDSVILIYGENLNLNEIGGRSVYIRGKIDSVAFE